MNGRPTGRLSQMTRPHTTTVERLGTNDVEATRVNPTNHADQEFPESKFGFSAIISDCEVVEAGS